MWLMDYRLREKLNKFSTYVVLFILLSMVIFPFYWIISTSFKNLEQFSSMRKVFIPDPLVFDNYRELLATTEFLTWFKNSTIVAFLTMLISVVAGCLGGYSLTRLKFAGRDSISSSILVTYLVPPTLLFIPLYFILKRFGVINSLSALVIVYPTFTIPFCTWLLMGIFRSIPFELEEAALIDGATRIQAFLKIILPLAVPGIVATALFSFTLSWNEFIYALVFTQDVGVRTLPVGLSGLIMGDVYLWRQLMAASVLATIPVVIFFMFLHKYMVQGLTAGAVKG